MDPWQNEELKVRSAAGILWAMQVLPYARTIAAFIISIMRQELQARAIFEPGLFAWEESSLHLSWR